jgi:hypothetical protein
MNYTLRKKQHINLLLVLILLLLCFPFFSFSQNTNSLNQNNDTKTLLWEKTRNSSNAIDTTVVYHDKTFDADKDPKTEMWMRQRSEAEFKHPDSLNRHAIRSDPSNDPKSILWEKNRQTKTEILNNNTNTNNDKEKKEIK